MAPGGRHLAVLLILVGAARAGSGPPPVAVLFPILEGGRWGFIDRAGRIVIPPRFESIVAADLESSVARTGSRRPRPSDLFMAPRVGPESGPIVGVKIAGRWGFVGPEGQVGEPRFDQVGGFSEGLAPVRIGERWGFADSTGRLAIPVQFDDVGRFVDGVCVIGVAGRRGVIDVGGRFVVRPRFEQIEARDSVFHDNRAVATLFGKKGYVSRGGTIAVPPVYDEAFRFSEGLAAVVRDGACGYVDTAGRAVVARRFQSGAPFHGGLALVMAGGRYGFIDRSGAWVVEPEFDEASGFSGGDLAPAKKGSRLGYVDRSGRWTATPAIELVRLDDSLSVARVEGRTGIVQRPSWTMVLAYPWESVGPFSEGLAPVRSRGTLFGFMDTAGTLVIPPRFNQADRFRHGLCKVAAADTLGYVDPTGKWVWFGIFRGHGGRYGDYWP